VIAGTQQQQAEGTRPPGLNENHQQEQRRAVTVEFARINRKETVILKLLYIFTCHLNH
jgi:hypothetical protein